MSVLSTLTAFGLTALTAASVAGPLAAAPAGDPLARYRWHARVLAVVAPAPDDPRLAEQRKLYTAMEAGARERDLVLVEAVGDRPGAAALRERFGVGSGGFRAVLIGKDGGEKLSAEKPLGPTELFPLIDSMPMRQGEAARRKS